MGVLLIEKLDESETIQTSVILEHLKPEKNPEKVEPVAQNRLHDCAKQRGSNAVLTMSKTTTVLVKVGFPKRLVQCDPRQSIIYAPCVTCPVLQTGF